MNNESPKKEVQTPKAEVQAEAPGDSLPPTTPQNTLLNLVKLNIGTPRFEVNSAGKEDPAEEVVPPQNLEIENGRPQEPLSAAEPEDVPKQTEPPAPEFKPENGEVQQNLEPAPEKVNGNIDQASAEPQPPRTFEIPQDELMRITGEDTTGGADQLNLENYVARVEPQEEKKGEEDLLAEAMEMVQEKVGMDFEPEKVEEPKEDNRIQEEQVEPNPAAIIEEEVAQEEPEQPMKIETEEPQVVVESVPVQIEEETPVEPVINADEIAEVCEQVIQTEPVPIMEEAVQEAEAVAQVEEEPVVVNEAEVVEEVQVQEPEANPEPEVQVEEEKQAEPEVQIEEEVKPEVQIEEEVQPEPEAEVPQPVEEPEPVSESEPEPKTVIAPLQVEELVPVVQKEPSPEPEVEPVPEVEAEPVAIQEESPEKPEVSEPTPVVQEEAKIEEETPKERDPILVRNEQISEDEKDNEYNTSGPNAVYAWGSGECDQFECSNYESRRPVEIGYFASNKVQVSKITCGSQHTLVLNSSGQVYSWGNSDDGVLGRTITGETSDTVPALVELDSQVDMISAGDSHSVFANSQTGELFFSGVIKSTNGRLSRVVNTPESITINKFKKSGIKTILSGANHVLIHSRFNVYAFGDNSCGALGYILRTYDQNEDCLTPHALRLKGIARIFTGAYHCFAITNKGILKTWGLNSQGQLGLPYYLDNPEDSDINHENPNRNPNVLQLPHQVGGIEGRKIVDIVGGEHHTLMVMSDGSVWGAGRNDEGQLGRLVKPERESYEEVRIPNSRVRVAGTSNYVNVTIDYMPNKFMRIPLDKSVQKIMARSHFNYALNTGEESWPKVYSWGSGFNYVLGNGKEESQRTPFRISNEKLFKGAVPSEIALGFSHVVYYTGETHEVKLDEPKPRNNRKRDRMTPIKRKNKYRGKRVKSK